MTQKSKMISIDAAPKKGTRVRLVGQLYTAKVPKAALAMRLAQFADNEALQKDASAAYDALGDLIDAMFDKDAGKVRARLDDPSDLLDVDHVQKLAEALVATAENPTT